MNQEEHIMLIVKLSLKLQFKKSSLCHYSDAYILVKGTISANNTAADCAAANNTNKKVIFKTVLHLLIV